MDVLAVLIIYYHLIDEKEIRAMLAHNTTKIMTSLMAPLMAPVMAPLIAPHIMTPLVAPLMAPLITPPEKVLGVDVKSSHITPSVK